MKNFVVCAVVGVICASIGFYAGYSYMKYSLIGQGIAVIKDGRFRIDDGVMNFVKNRKRSLIDRTENE